MSIVLDYFVQCVHVLLSAKAKLEKLDILPSYCWSIYGVVIGIDRAAHVVHVVLEGPVMVDTKGVDDAGAGL